MRVLFSSLGTHGHTYPLLPLARAARAVGHEVVFATDASLAPALAGLEAVEAGASIREVFGQLPAQFAEKRDLLTMQAEVFGSALPRRFYADLLPIVERLRPDLVVHEYGNPGAGLAALAKGVPALCHGFGFATNGFEVAAERFGQVAAELGFDVPASFVLGNRLIDVCPPSLRTSPDEVVDLRLVPFAEPGEVVLPRGDRPLVYLTLGTAFGSVDVLRTAIAGLAALDVRLLVSTGPTVDAAEFADVPDNVLIRSWVPQADLLRHVDLVVHHGGSGTTLGAMVDGVPQLVLPQGADQFTNTAVVEKAGVGEGLQGDDVTAEAVGTRARALLADEAVRDAARALAAEIAAMPSPEDVARRLPDYAG